MGSGDWKFIKEPALHKQVAASVCYQRRDFRFFSASASLPADEEEVEDYDDEEGQNEDSKKTLAPLSFKNWDMNYLQNLEERGKLNLQPFYQRGFKWTQKQASAWIESILRGYPSVPEIILLNVIDENESSKWVVFDGQQRLSSTFFFIRNQQGTKWRKKKDDGSFRLVGLPLLKQLEGKTFKELTVAQQNDIKESSVRVAIIPSSWEMADYMDFFKRIQGGGTPMTDQELRRALSQGPFTELLFELSRTDTVLQAIGSSSKYSTGSDGLQELLLRYFQYQKFHERFAKPTISQNGLETMKYYNREMKSWTGKDFDRRDQLSSPLKKSLALVSFVFGPDEAFRRPQPLMKKGDIVDEETLKRVWTNQSTIKPILWDCTVCTFARLEILSVERQIRENAADIRAALIDLMQTDTLFTDSYRSADISARVRAMEIAILSIVDMSSNKRMTREVCSQQRRELIRGARQHSRVCSLCQQELGPHDVLHIDHIHPVSKGGTNQLSNLQVVHKWCNLKKSNKSMIE